MARKTDTMTPRQRQSARIMREKAAMKRRKVLLRKMQYIGAAVAIVLGAAGGFWMWKNSVISRSITAMVDGGYQATADVGISLQSLYLEGRNRTAMADIEQALGVSKGDPILQASLSGMRERLEKIPSVKTAAVERALPGTLYVRIVEREPVALWQHAGKIALVDDNGVVMDDLDSAPYRHLPLIVGPGAPAHIAELLGILVQEPELRKRFTAAVWVGDRRWNIRLSGDVEVKLPEKDAIDAWKTLGGLQAHQQLLDRDVKAIDLRAPGKLFIKLSPQDMPVKGTGSAKET